MIPSAISDILTAWENDPANAYGAPLVELSAAGGSTFVVSDLHTGAGLARDGTYDGLENFFADAAFVRFLEWAHCRAAGRGALLVINGDFIDFLRIVNLPDDDGAFEEWSRMLAELGISRTAADLRASITAKERRFGLKTHDYKSVFKLSVAARGHGDLFDGLAAWLARGHRLVVTKGNHDLEWYWRAVRNQLRFILAAAMVRQEMAQNIPQALTERVLAGVSFADNAVLLDRNVYIEHGHRYDKFTTVLDGPVLPGGVELNIPFGSFFNRYVINTVELRYPFADKVRPAEHLLALMVQQHFPTAMKLLLAHIPFMVLIIPKGYYRYMLSRVIPLAAALIAPLALLAWNLRSSLGSLLFHGSSTGLISSMEQQLGLPVLSYFLGRLVAYLQLQEPSDLDGAARALLEGHPDFRLVTLGHTHNPDQLALGGRRYCNTGTWIPVVEVSTLEVRDDRTYTFIEIDNGAELGQIRLQRWNDDAGRADVLSVIRNRY